MKIIQDSFDANIKIAESYNRSARFHLNENDFTLAETYERLANDSLGQANECELALEELKAIA